jgi:hypothetical protein
VDVARNDDYAEVGRMGNPAGEKSAVEGQKLNAWELAKTEGGQGLDRDRRLTKLGSSLLRKARLEVVMPGQENPMPTVKLIWDEYYWLVRAQQARTKLGHIRNAECKRLMAEIAKTYEQLGELSRNFHKAAMLAGKEMERDGAAVTYRAGPELERIGVGRNGGQR